MIEFVNVCKTYEGKVPVDALKDVSLKINDGEFISVVGTSGSGKTTLLSILGLIDKSTSGDVLFDKKNISKYKERELALIRGESIGIVVQDFALVKKFSVEENIAMALDFKRTQKYNRHSVEEVLKMVGLEGYEKRKINELSGGQQQRVAIARALIKKPALLLCDEPTGNLDTKTSKQIIELLEHINSFGTTIVLITHDEAIAKRTKRLVKIEDGIIIGDVEL